MISKRVLFVAVILLPILTTVHRTATAQSGTCQEAMVPAYFYPRVWTGEGHLWEIATKGLPKLGKDRHRMLVMNPSNGPGNSVDPNYVVVHKLAEEEADNGLLLLGYVATNYAAKPVSAVVAEMLMYHNKDYFGDGTSDGHMDGMFLDEVSTIPADVPYYQRIVKEYTRKHPGNDIVMNQGVLPNHDAYMAIKGRGKSNIIFVTFEGDAATYINSYPSYDWPSTYAAWRFVHLVYDTPLVDMGRVADLAAQRGAEWIYITPDTISDGNPWDTLSGLDGNSPAPDGAYWHEFIAYIEASCGQSDL